MAWHTKWRTEWELDTMSDRCRLHEFFCGVLETMVRYDQTHAPNLAVAELICRQLQYIEEQQYEDSAAAGTKKVGKTDKVATDTETSIFMGTRAMHSGIYVWPEFTEWLAEQPRADATVAKERRQAREERALRK